MTSVYRLGLLGVAGVFLVAVGGCGEPGGVEEGATVRVYVTAPLCQGAEEVLARHGVEAGGVRPEVVCLPNAEGSEELDLAQIGANARRATEDSSSIAYIGERSKSASRFSAPILEAAEIKQYAQQSGDAAMTELLRELEDGQLSPRGNL